MTPHRAPRLEGAAPAALVRELATARFNGPRGSAALQCAVPILLVLLATPAFADVYWQRPDALGAGQRGALELVFEDSEPTAPVTLPAVDGLRLLGAPSQANTISIVNGRRSATLTLSFPVRAEHTGAVEIPAFEVETSDGTQTVAPLRVAVERAALRDTDGAVRAVDDAVQARLTPSNMTPYAGEVFDLELTVSLTGNRRGQVVGSPAWDAAPLNAEPWSEGHAVSAASGGAVQFHTRAVAPQAGRVQVAPADQELQVESGRARNPLAGMDPFGSMRRFGAGSLFDQFFGGAAMTAVTARSNAVQLDVAPLPQPAPADFSGAVGQFTLESRLVPEAPTTGEPVTWTLTLSGTGNWPSGIALPARAVPADLRTLQPKQHSSFAGGRFSGEVSEDLVLVPHQPGDLALAPVRFTFFNPESARYETIEARPPVLHITGAPLPAAAPAPQAAAASADVPAAPALGDALPGSGAGMAPLPWTVLRWWLVGPLALALALRAARAGWRAWQRHPRRLARRMARAMRAAVIAARQASTVETRLVALLAWQQAAAQVLGVDRAAPTAEQLAGIDDPRWAQAWAGSELALYARAHALPAGWCELALALCTPPRAATATPVGSDAARPVLAQAATAALLLVALAAPLRADDAADPREALRAQVAAQPLDWVARYNLGRAEAQAGDAGRALGQTVAALAQAPRDAAVRANAARLAHGVSGADAGLAPLLAGRLTALAPVATWQMVLIAAALLTAAGIAVGRRRVALASIAGGVLVAGVAAIALHEYDIYADPRAALVAESAPLHALPTDAEAADGLPSLTAGTPVIAERAFLGWTQVRGADGRAGWLRRGQLVPLYGVEA
jgi:hypothetical protein